MKPPVKNGIKWFQLWSVLAGLVALGGAALALHAQHPHDGAVQREEQVQFEKRMVERFNRIEMRQVEHGRDLRQLLSRIKK